MSDDIRKYLEIQELATKAGLKFEYKQGGVMTLTDRVTPKRSNLEPQAYHTEEKIVMSAKCIDTVYGAVRGYLFAKEYL